MIYLKTYEKFTEVDVPHGVDEFSYGKMSQHDIDKVKLFIADLRKKCEEKGIKLKIENRPGIPYTDDDSMMVNGYFDEDNKVLACAVGKDIEFWLTILIHESSHMDQFLESDPSWTNLLGLDQTDAWLAGGEGNPEEMEKEIKASISVELDCEKRSVEKIKKWGLDSIVDVVEYTQKSNAYILFYHWMYKSRKWYTIGREPYNNKDIVSRMPKDFNIDYSKLTPEIEDVFKTYL